MLKPGKRTAATAALAAGAMALAACGGSGDSGAGADTFTIWHYEGPDSAMGVAWQQAVEQFEAEHPDVRVEVEEKGFEQIQKTAPMVLNSDEAPDILEYNKGNATTGLLAKQGLLTDMTEEVAARGWDELLAPTIQTTARYDERGVMGSGNWYGIPNYAEYVMVYYNKDMFAEHGVEVPTTFDEFTAAMDAFVQAGVTPLSLAGSEYPAQQILYQLALSKADRAWVDAFQRYTGPVDFHDEAWTYAANTFAEWMDGGYISEDSAGLKAEEMGTAFISGDFPIMVSGSWWYGRFQAEISDFEWGTFLWPGNTMSAGSSGNLWVIPQGTQNRDLAYDFIDITMSEEIQNTLGNEGGIPVAADPSAIEDPKSQELIEDFDTLAERDGLAFYPDWPAPGYYDVLVSGVQKLINDNAAPQQVLDEIAGPYQEHAASLGG